MRVLQFSRESILALPLCEYKIQAGFPSPAIVIAVVNEEFTVKRFKIIHGKFMLAAENPDYSNIELTENSYIWGVVTSVINKL